MMAINQKPHPNGTIFAGKLVNHLQEDFDVLSPTKLEVATEKQMIQTWAKLLGSFRRHRNHHSPVYVILTIKLECQGLLDFGVINKSISSEDNQNYDYEVSEVSSTSDYKSGSDEEEEKKDLKGPLKSFHFVAINLIPGSSEKHFDFQPLFKGQSYLDVFKQTINFFAQLDSLMLSFKELEDHKSKGLSYIIEELLAGNSEVLKMHDGCEECTNEDEYNFGKTKKIFWCYFELVNVGVFSCNVNYFVGPAILASAAEVVGALKLLLDELEKIK